MPLKIKFTTRAAFAALLMLVVGAAVAESPDPSISLTHPSAATTQTTESSISLSGSATAQGRISKVYCIDQSGHRHDGILGDSGQHGETSWTLTGISLRSGLNLLTVTVVDSANRSASLHLAVNRKLAEGAPPNSARQVASGLLQNRPIVYQIWNGQAVIEGDIIVHPTAVSGAKSPAQPAAMTGITPDFAINYTSQQWTKVGAVYQVPYIVNGSAANLTTALENFNTTFSGLIQFVPCSAPPNTSCSLAAYVDITVLSGGGGEGSSWVGVAPPAYQPQPLQCGNGCTVATWLHEMGHTIGLLHEHQRPDRGNYITLNLGNADLPNVPGNFTLFNYDYQTIGLYDYASVMHYCSFCFSKAGQPVLESIPAGIPLGNDDGYSAGDVDQIERLYGVAPSGVTVTTNPNGLQIIVDGTAYTAPQTFTFALNSTHTLAVPADPQYTNPADGSTYAFGNWNDLGASSHTIYVLPGSGTLVSPQKKAAVTVYEANYIRLQPFAFLSPAAYPSGSGTVSVNPQPIAEFGGSFFVDRTLVTLTYTKNAGFNFFDWYNLPFPASENPLSFYIQIPTTNAQAVSPPGANPVTIVGASFTGPNTWNPLVMGIIDQGTANEKDVILPSGFTPFNGYNPNWSAGSTHSITVDQTQSPVTTNIYYNWNSWTDGQAITHSIVQPNTGANTVTASFTPFYATYTLAPSCAGGVTTFPAPTPYSDNTTFDFYEDGTSVMSTATPNSMYPEIKFAGWTGSTGGLTGKTSPSTTTLHGQFVPTANFNVTTTPLAITSFTPAKEVASATAAPAITVKGTGFANGYTYAYWNGAYRGLSAVTPTQFTMQLQAGDLANAGGQDVFVGNYTMSPAGCGVTTEASYTVAATAAGKATTAVTLTPAALTFAATEVGSSTAPQTLTLKNTGTATLAIGSISLWGAYTSSFALGSNTCGAALAAGASCTFTAAFAPKVPGALTGTIAINDDATGSPQMVALKGTGTAPVVSLTPAAITFAATKVGTTSGAKTVTLKNTGTAALTIASIVLGGANPTSFVIQSNNCPSTLATGMSCTVTVAFKPTATGALSATVAATDNATGSPQLVTLKGTGS